MDVDGNYKVYAAGFKTYLEEYKLGKSDENGSVTYPTYAGAQGNLFYKTDFNNSDELILACINQMLQPKYHNYKFYCHNFGNFDLYFIYSVLEKYNTRCEKEVGAKDYLNPATLTNLDNYPKVNNNSDSVASVTREESAPFIRLHKGYEINMIFRDDQVLKLDLKVKCKLLKPIKVKL